ncbi:Fc.00g054190.m01.CDS01 [Cosmosporella sp. VM-42]
MAGPLQVGDIINLGKLAWDVYRYGWSDDLNATRQYLEFGKDVKGLAESLDILTRVVHEATSSLQKQGAYNNQARWDPRSLYQIIGDYQSTLRECYELIQSNQRYRVGSNPLRNIEWNALVQPTADGLRQRIALHNSKVLQVLKPFEIDLLCRVRQDIAYMHQDITNQIQAVHNDVHRLMGVVVPDLEQELRQQAQQNHFLLPVPIDVAERFRFAALAERPEYGTDEAFELHELADALVFNYKDSTVYFDARGKLLVTERIPPIDQYVNLLKCVWLWRRIKDSPQLQSIDPDSHWPSYVQQLEYDLSFQCSRFKGELVQPELVALNMRQDIFSIWPMKEPAPLVDVVTQDEIMEELLEVPLQTSTTSVEQKAKLLRRMGSDGRRFRVMISGTEQMAAGRPRQQTEVIDFDITSAVLEPRYALPSGTGMVREIILRRDERIARMSFTTMKNMLKFQQAVTGFKAWASYIQYNVMVSFVLAGRKDPVFEKACLQFWIPKETDGSLVTNSDAAADAIKTGYPARTPSMATSSAFGTAPSSPPSNRDSFRRDSFPRYSNPFGISGETLTNPMGRQPSLQTIPQRQTPSPGVFSTSWPRQASPPSMGSSPPGQGFYSMGGSQRVSISRKPVGQPSSPRRSGTLNTTISNSTNGTPPGRTYSMSSALSTAARSNTSNSSGSEARSVTISTGSRTTGFLHKRPPKPMLVLFTQNPQDGQLSFVTIQIDEETAVNPDRCNCRRSGRDGASCPIAAIERRKGDANITARRFETSRTGGEMDWNIARLALNNPESTGEAATWPNLKRFSIVFPTAADRAKFGGTPNQCQCKSKKEVGLSNCLKSGHRGLWGEVQEFHRREAKRYHEARYGAQQHVVNGLMS